MDIIKQPPATHTAFNPVVLRVAETVAEEIFIGVEKGGNTYATQAREVINGAAVFDISGAIKRLFELGVEDTNPPTDYTLLDGQLAASYTLSIQTTGGETESIPIRTAINAVVQVGESSDLTKWGDCLLTGFNKLKKYESYPLGVSFLNNSQIAYLLFGDEQINASPIEDAHFCISIPNGVSEISFAKSVESIPIIVAGSQLTAATGEPILARGKILSEGAVKMEVKQECTPQSPFYVRWINQKGGRDYWMFSFRQTIEKSVDNVDTATPFILDQENAKGFSKVIGLEAEIKATVGAALQGDEFDTVSNIIFSPQIEWYREDIGKWAQLIIDSSSIEKDTRTGGGNIEITFLLPQIQTQF